MLVVVLGKIQHSVRIARAALSTWMKPRSICFTPPVYACNSCLPHHRGKVSTIPWQIFGITSALPSQPGNQQPIVPKQSGRSSSKIRASSTATAIPGISYHLRVTDGRWHDEDLLLTRIHRLSNRLRRKSRCKHRIPGHCQIWRVGFRTDKNPSFPIALVR